MDMELGALDTASVYEGAFACSAVKMQHFRCACGHLGAIELASHVDAAGSPDLAAMAVESEPGRALHELQCQACGARQSATMPFTYHDGGRQLFALVLPDPWRHRELLERSALLLVLAEAPTSLPNYIVDFAVVYGAEGLREHLRKVDARSEDAAADRDRLRELEQRLDEAATRELKLKSRMQELDARTSTLAEKKLDLDDRKSALDRRTAELERKAVALEEAKTKLRADNKGELPAVLKEDATAVLEDDQILTSAPDLTMTGRMRIPAATAVSGHSATFRNGFAFGEESLEAMVAPLEDPEVEDGATRVAPTEQMGGPDALADSAIGEYFAQDTEPRIGRGIKGLRAAGSSLVPPAPESVATEVTLATTSDHEVEVWRKSAGTVLTLLRGQEVRLIASLSGAVLHELLATDTRAILQFHRLPTYPLVSLTLARETTLNGQDGHPYSFHFDIGKPEHRNILSSLTKDFHFALEMYDTERSAMGQRHVSAPLASNVRYVVALAADARKDIPLQTRSFEQAIIAFNRESHDGLGRRHPLAREFRDSLLDELAKPGDVIAAMTQCEKFSEPAGEEYLVALRSYPLDRWHERRLQVIRRALELGLWIGPALARVAVVEKLVRSRKELIATCQKNFARFIGEGHRGLGEDQIAANLASLSDEARALGLASRAGLSSTMEAVASGMNSRRKTTPPPGPSSCLGESDSAVLRRLEEPEGRLQAIVELSQRKTLPGLDPLFRALAELSVEEAPDAFAAVTGLGNQAADSLLVLLSCPSPHLRHGAAMALCELGNDEGIDFICEALMRDEGTMWSEYAVALGRVGSSAIMPLVARIADQGERGQTRAVWPLGYIAAGGARKPVATLAAGRDAQVAKAASAALTLADSLLEGSVRAERDTSEQAFSERFYQARAGTQSPYVGADTSGPAMLLDEGDLMEASE